jgi:hypothetical protein
MEGGDVILAGVWEMSEPGLIQSGEASGSGIARLPGVDHGLGQWGCGAFCRDFGASSFAVDCRTGVANRRRGYKWIFGAELEPPALVDLVWCFCALPRVHDVKTGCEGGSLRVLFFRGRA